MKRAICRWLMLFVAVVLTGGQVYAQGVTTATIQGTVVDDTGEPLPGANVIAVHQPSGTTVGTITREDGRYTLPNVRVGGPYVVTATYVGFQNKVEQGFSLALGQQRTVNFALAATTTELGEVQVYAAADEIINPDRTGAEATFNREQIEALPTFNRSLSDITRLSPANTGTNSFGGRNNLYNNITVDGSNFNNVFGLSSEVGGQTNANPISLDAVEQIQVSLAPYDVREAMFTGASVNLITRAGTNQFQGSLYTFSRNESLISSSAAGITDLARDNFSQTSTGITLGGPIVKNRVFFFVNGELGRREDPGSNFRPYTDASQIGEPGYSNVAETDLERLRNLLMAKYDYDPGTYGPYNQSSDNNKLTARVDINLAQNHRLNVRYNYLDSFKDQIVSNSTSQGGGRQPSSNRLPFSGVNYVINNDMHSMVAQLNSTFGNRYSNTLTAGLTTLRDSRSVPSSPFPTVDILAAGTGSTLTSFGYEPFSANNLLDTDIWQIADNFTGYFGKHTVTVGTSNEYIRTANGFMRFYNGYYAFRSLADFEAHVNAANPAAADVPQPFYYYQTYSAIEGQAAPLAEMEVLQLGLYAQDEFQVKEGLKLTVGIRGDVPMFLNDLQRNTMVEGLTFAGGQKIDVSKYPKTSILWSPRLGFNWDVNNDRKIQVRGGTGIFSGRPPYVWISNQASANGVLFGTTEVNAQRTSASTTPLCMPGTGGANQPACDRIVFSGDPTANIPENATLPAQVAINAAADDFKYPQVWRTSLGFDVTLPYGVVATVDALYSKDVNAVFHRNVNLEPSTARFTGADDRAIFPAGLLPSNASSSARTNAVRVNDNIQEGVILDNTSKGYQYMVTAELRKNWGDNLFTSVAYTNAMARDLTSSTSAQAGTSFNNNQIVQNPNAPEMGYSFNDQRHRVMAQGSLRLEALGLSGTRLSLVYVGSSGFNYSYTYSGDYNGDGISGNDLVYIPESRSDVLLATASSSDTRSLDEIWSEMDAFIEQDPYLSEHRGEYAVRGGARQPWYSRFDLGVKQEFFINVGGQRNALEFSLDLINVGNLLNKDWGVTYFTNNSNPFIARGVRQTVVGDETQYQQQISFPVNRENDGPGVTESFGKSTGLGSRWQAQFGVRYRFN